MISFFIDTAISPVTLALLKNNQILDVLQESNNHDLSEKLLSKIDGLLSKNKISINDIEKIYVGIGPGSFTGIRIGVTIAKTLAFCKNIPIIPISSLELLATTNTETDYIVPVIDARRNCVYGAIYDENLNTYKEDCYIAIEELKKCIPEEKTVTYVSYDELKLEPMIKPNIQIEKIIKKHIQDKPTNPHNCNPIYLKKTEAEEKRIND